LNHLCISLPNDLFSKTDQLFRWTQCQRNDKDEKTGYEKISYENILAASDHKAGPGEII
jgi:hypothetical protein